MKNFTLALISCATLSSLSSINAQEAKKELKNPWSFGVKGGLNLLNNEYDDKAVGLNIGATVEYDLRNRFFLRSGLEFTAKKGYTNEPWYSTTSTLEDGSMETRYSGMRAERTNTFLQVPITLGYRLPISKHANLTLNAGVYAGVGLFSSGSYSKWNNKITVDNEGNTSDYKDDVQHGNLDKAGNLDFGLMGGIGLEYKKFSYNVNYEHGLVNQSGKAYKKLGGSSLKQNNISFSVGYTF